MEYYSAIKRNGFESILVRGVSLEPVIQSDVSQKEKQISHINMYIWNLEKWYWWTYLQGSSRDTGASQVVVVVKNMPSSAADVRDTGSIPGAGRSAGGGHGNPLQYSGLENPMDRGAWWATVHALQRVRHDWSNLACNRDTDIENRLVDTVGEEECGMNGE